MAMPSHSDDDDGANPHLFAGVRFALTGFDDVSRTNYRMDMERAGGIDAGDWDGDCTHVIISGLLYDDPVCVTARKDGKKVVTEQWVDDSFELGVLPDADRVSLFCIRNCEKYKAAKHVNIKLVNHRWLEDCLKAWEILPIDNYKKSGWEMELMETQVMDSEDETEDAGRASSSNTRITKSTPVTEIRMRTPVDSDFLLVVELTRGGNDDANQVTRDEAEDYHVRAPETTVPALYTPGLHKSIATPIQVDNIENIDANCLRNSNLVTANNVLQPNPSKENLSRTTLFSPDGHTPHLKSTALHSLVEEKPKSSESSVRSEGNSTSRNNHITGYSRRRSSKSMSPADTDLRSAQQKSSPQSSEGNKSRSGSALAQRRKSILSSVSPKPPNGDPGSGAGLVSSLVSSKENASEGATVSELNRNSAECTKVGGHCNSGPTVNSTKKHISGSFKSSLLSSRRTSLKLVISSEEKGLPENSSNGKNMGALGEVRKDSSGVSVQNGDTGMSDAEQVNKVDVAAPSSESDKAVPQQSLEAGPKDTPVNTVIGQDSITSTKVSTSRVKNASARRSRDSGSEAAAVFAKRKPEVAASKPMHDKAVSLENADTQQGEKCRSPAAAADSALLFAEEISNGKPRSEASKAEFVNVNPQKNMEDHKKLLSSASADENLEKSSKEVPDSLARNSVAEGPHTADGIRADSPTAENFETVSLKPNFSEVVPPENKETYLKKLSSSASTGDPETCTADKVPNSRARKVVAKRKISAVRKQKFGSELCKEAGVFVTKDRVVSSERAAQNSRNANKVTADQDVQNTTEDKAHDPVESFCKDTIEDRSKDTQNFKSRSNKRQKTAELVDCPMDHDKENIPVSCNFTSSTKYGNKSISSKSISKALPNGKAVLDENSVIKGHNCGTLNVLELTWFILSGHRLLRKEYKSILSCLKGRVCRDSHNWSFQATHLVATELRRTEKFFAAAASGSVSFPLFPSKKRWILKPDYLTACNEAGKFLGEEPFEWHGHGLNSNETISLDAPRKWRQHKQRTGHGAFYGMQIVIYGECIAPTLVRLCASVCCVLLNGKMFQHSRFLFLFPQDTLKRVIRAGDGTILATSPPYTRLFKSNVDFAVVSQGIPSVDAWVQEFVRHKIPCISADYLVEYVCKPGYSLTKHVLFDMHDLAEKSLENLLKNQQDGITGEAAEGCETDVACSTCGTNDLDRPMLICGSDRNSTGCGVRVHVDCCNPPFEAAVPAGEWLCNKCDVSKPAKKAKKSAKSRVLKCR
ncbi:hypothetical protein PR202_gb22096 [Eleusine coracana subsp. coracana]|uniref:BRCT domain-containing protein n=1 Tax=Eleusine coracana subsp. coracana TaxID=191504 RepID=A0AAV5FGD6_ELECO|nr:hypothetical protein PR202_gb22096 [Eleusine coracana subsp. coracana]